MRVTERFRHEERGAVALIVALALTVLIGMLVLTADLGRMVGIRRELVRAADAAALAAAQECALGNGSGAARAAAVDLIQQNRAGATLTTFVVDEACDGAASSGQKVVRVKASTSVEMFFAPIFGFDERPVGAEATAIWTVPGIVPITVNAVPMQDCNEGDTCVITYPKGELENPRWGILDLELWGLSDASSCPVPNSEIVDIILGGGWPRPDTPAFDCLDNGAQFSSWDTLKDGTWWFPVMDVTLSKGVTEPGNPKEPCTGADIPALQAAGRDCRITNAWIIDFVRLKVLDVYIAPGTGGSIVLDVERVPWKGSAAGIEIRLVD